MKVTSSSGVNIHGSFIFHVVALVMLTRLNLLVNTKPCVFFVGLTYDFTSEMMLPHLTYWNYAQIDVRVF